MNSNNDLLKMALSRMEGSFSPVTLSAWFDDAEAVSLEGTSFVLRAANQFKKEIIESRFTAPLQQALTELLGEPITLSVVYGDQVRPRKKPVSPSVFPPTRNTPLSTSLLVRPTSSPTRLPFRSQIIRLKTTIRSLFMVSPVWAKPTFCMQSAM